MIAVASAGVSQLQWDDCLDFIGGIGPEAEENEAFWSYSRAFRGIGLHVPEIFATDPIAFSTMLARPPRLLPGVVLAERSTPPRRRYSSYQLLISANRKVDAPYMNGIWTNLKVQG